MVKTRRGFVFSTTFFSGIAVVLSIASLVTEEWVRAKGEFTDAGGSNEQLSTIKYGLFSGTFWQILGSTTAFEIKMTCVIEENACAYLCELNSELRRAQLKRLIRGEQVDFNPSCPKVSRVNDFYTPVPKATNRNDQYKFINAGLYISTVVFLSISVVFGLISTILSIYNTLSSPIEVYFSITGLYIYNAVAFIASLLAISLWSALFGTMIVDNVGILYTIKGTMNTRGWTFLGYSFWLLLPSCFLYPISIAALFIRQYLIEQEPVAKIHTTSGEADVGEIMIY